MEAQNLNHQTAREVLETNSFFFFFGVIHGFYFAFKRDRRARLLDNGNELVECEVNDARGKG